MRFAFRLLLAITAFGSAGAIHAADIITWNTPVLISGDTDVDTTGSLLYAYNLGSSGVTSTTVNGVGFSAWAFPANGTSTTSTTPTIANANFTETPGRLFSSNGLGTVTGAFSSLTTEYKALLGTAGYADQFTTMTLTLNNLTPGQSYLFQWWINNSSLALSAGSDRNMRLTTSTAGNAVGLASNVAGTTGALGQYVSGTFTASSSSTTIAYTGTDGSNVPLINAFQLRVVPEPSTWALGGIATMVLFSAARRRNRA